MGRHQVVTNVRSCGKPVDCDKPVDKQLHTIHEKENDLSSNDKSTNRGLISENRSTEATLVLTIPRSCLSRLHRIYLWKF